MKVKSFSVNFIYLRFLICDDKNRQRMFGSLYSDFLIQNSGLNEKYSMFNVCFKGYFLKVSLIGQSGL